MMKKRVLYLDVLNVLACIAVIALHHNSHVWQFDHSNSWKVSLFIECALYWAVPVFLMISGANLLDYRNKYSTKTFIKKRMLKTVFPWLIWSVFFLIWKVQTGQLILEKKSFTYILELIFNYKVESVYWFFGALFACYLAIPVFSLLTNNRDILWYIVGLNFIFVSCLPIIKILFELNWSLDIPVVGSLIIYVLLGYLFATGNIDKKKRFLIYFLGIAGVAFRLIYTYMKSTENQATDVSIKGYGMFYAVFFSISVFVLGKSVKWDEILGETAQKIITVMSSYSFGVFLIHKMVMYYEKSFFSVDIRTLQWKVCFVPVTYCISLMIVFFLKRVPFIKHIVP